jgi:nitroreductase
LLKEPLINPTSAILITICKEVSSMIKDLILKNRSYRRFYEHVSISSDTLRSFVELARLSASAGNIQPLRYYLSNTQKTNNMIFSTLGWAGYLDWAGPEEGERPTAYIVILKDVASSSNHTVDEGIAAQSILLGAVEAGFGGCMLGNIKRNELSALLALDEKHSIILVIALGKPKEEIVLDPVSEDGSIKYWRSADKVHHVPKRSLEDIIL